MEDEKFANIGKKILQSKHTNTLEKIQHKSLFNIFHNEGVSRRTIPSYVEKRYVETIYPQL